MEGGYSNEPPAASLPQNRASVCSWRPVLIRATESLPSAIHHACGRQPRQRKGGIPTGDPARKGSGDGAKFRREDCSWNEMALEKFLRLVRSPGVAPAEKIEMQRARRAGGRINRLQLPETSQRIVGVKTAVRCSDVD